MHQDENELVINTANDEKKEDDQVEEVEMRNMIRSQNRKKKSGGFQSMGKYFDCEVSSNEIYWSSNLYQKKCATTYHGKMLTGFIFIS